MRTNGSMMIHNKYTDRSTAMDLWQETKIDEAMWQNKEGITFGNLTITSSDETRVFIPFSVSAEKNREFLSPGEFKKAEDKDKYFTFQNGDRLERNGEKITITSIKTHDYGSINMQHWEITGK